MLGLETQIDHLHRARAISSRIWVFQLPVFGAPIYAGMPIRWLRLRETGFSYDSSQALALDVVGESGNRLHTAVLWSFTVRKSIEIILLCQACLDGLVRIPYCLPDDEALNRSSAYHRRKDYCRYLAGNAGSRLPKQVNYSPWDYTQSGHLRARQPCRRFWQRRARSLLGVWIARLDEIAAWFRSLERLLLKYTPRVVISTMLKLPLPTGQLSWFDH